jgi:hypothetical protein
MQNCAQPASAAGPEVAHPGNCCVLTIAADMALEAQVKVEYYVFGLWLCCTIYTITLMNGMRSASW